MAMQKMVLPLAFATALAGGLVISQLENGNTRQGFQTASSFGLCLKTGFGCSR